MHKPDDKPTLRKLLRRHWHHLLDLLYPPLPDETAERWRLQEEVRRLLDENDKLRRELANSRKHRR
jgi:hypothetical protein